MAATPLGRLAVGAFLALMLAACEDGQNPFARLAAGPSATEDGESSGTPASGPTTVERDVEAPDAFSSSDQGLWDGRPSLGGIWVAHPDVTEPERVLIRNVANGRETTGALYRREREMPGPRLQVSSDAAAALGMLAGAPTDMRVVALRRERIEVAPPADAPLATGAIEAASLDAPPPAAEPAPTQAAAAPTSRNRPTARPERTATPAPATPASAAPAPSAAASEAQPPAPATAPSSAAAQAAPLAGGSFVQVGIFSQQSNAESSADTLREAGMVPTVREQESGDRKVWRVLVGPVATASDRAALLERIREIGFTDAYVIRN